MRSSISGSVLAIGAAAFAVGCGPADSFELGSSRSALTGSATYLNATATIEVPDAIEPDTEFPVTVTGTLIGGASWSIYSWQLWENAEWSYDPLSHMFAPTSGTRLASRGFNMGAAFSQTFLLTRPAGTYKYTFVLGDRRVQHGYYDVAVDVSAEVAHQPVVCNTSWHQSLGKGHKAGNTVPLKFTAFDCATGFFLHDEGVRVDLYAPDGTLAASWVYTGNPTTGINIVDVDQLYQVNWKTPRSPGVYTLTVTFSSGDHFAGTITLE